MELFDTHFHFYNEESPEDFCRQLECDFDLYMMAVGGNFEESIKAQQFADAIEKSAFSVGIHPHSAKERGESERFAVFRNASKLAAVGELGLDYYYDLSDRKIQREVFEEFLTLALEWNLPAIVHCRDKDDCFVAYEECFEILKDFAAADGCFVVHCFSGTPSWSEKFLSLGGYLGVTGMVTFNKAHNIRENLQVIPLERLLLESDAPYLAPVPFRGKKNHPAYTINTARKVAEELALPLEVVAAATTANAKKFYNWQEIVG